MAEGINETLIANAIGGGDTPGVGATDIRKKLILAMLQQGTSTEPTNLAGGLNRVAQALLGNLELRDLDLAQKAHMKGLIDLYTGGQRGGPAAPSGPTRDLTPTPRSFGGPQEPPAASPEPPFRPVAPLTNLTEQPDTDTAKVAAAAGTTPLVPPGPLPDVMSGSPSPQTTAALDVMRQQGAGGGLPTGPAGQNALPNSQQAPGFAGPMRPDEFPFTRGPGAVTALQPQQQPGAGLPPPLAPPGPPVAGPTASQRPLTPSAPRESQTSLTPPMTPERRRALIEAVAHPDTPAAFKALFAKQLNPKIEMKEVTDQNGEKVNVWVNTDTQQVLGRVAVPEALPDPASTIPQPPPGMTPAQRKEWNETQAKRIASEALPATDENVHKLRTQFTGLKQAQNMAEAAPIYKSMTDTAGLNDRQSDLNLVYGLAKLLDPTSVVRDAETVMVQKTQSLGNELLGQINRVNGGQGLQPEEREKIMNVAYSRMNRYHSEYESSAKFYRDIAKSNRMNPAHVIQEYPKPEKWTRPETNVSPADLAAEILRRQQKLQPHLGGGR